VPAGNEALVKGLEHEWPRYLGYVVSFTFIGGVWIAHNYMTRFVKATDRGLIRLNLLLLLFVSFLPFTTAIAATHLFPSVLPFADHAVTRPDLAAERVAVVIFGLNLTLAALMLYVMIRHAGRTPGLAADDTAQLGTAGLRQRTQDGGAAPGERRRRRHPPARDRRHLLPGGIGDLPDRAVPGGGYSCTARCPARETLILVCGPRWWGGHPPTIRIAGICDSSLAGRPGMSSPLPG
jgi:hypothetical protein